ncbi:MAG: response regulator [Candidatus Methanospirareceae archaeon]
MEAGAGPRVLLAEDNESNQKLAIRLLEKNGCLVTAVENGLEVIEALGKESFDLVFMDVQMPVMDGIEATQRIRESKGGSEHIPIIAMTAHAMAGDRERLLDAGMDDYISKSKPIDLNILSQKIKYWCDKINYLSFRLYILDPQHIHNLPLYP